MPVMTLEEPIVVTVDPTLTSSSVASRNGHHSETELATFTRAAVVQLIGGEALSPDAVIEDLHPASVVVTDKRVAAIDGEIEWSWLVAEIETIIHGVDEGWTLFVVPGIADFGVSVPVECVGEFRYVVDGLPGIQVRHQQRRPVHTPLLPPPLPGPVPLVITEATTITGVVPITAPPMITDLPGVTPTIEQASSPRRPDLGDGRRQVVADPTSGPASLAGIDARNISAWFGSHQVLDRVSLNMAAGEVTALIGPSGCGKSTFLRILNRMHEMIPSAAMAGEVLVDGHDIYDANRKLTDARREIGMVFQKPNPFPAMSIYDNVVASLRLTGVKASVAVKDEIVESCLTKAGLWLEVRDRLRQPGGGLSGGQQQRLCIARALAIRPRVLLMDEPCSALDPTSTRRIEETVMQLVSEVTIVIVTHNMQQAARVSNRCAFFLAEHGVPGTIVEHGPTTAMFGSPQDPRTSDYVMGRFG